MKDYVAICFGFFVVLCLMWFGFQPPQLAAGAPSITFPNGTFYFQATNVWIHTNGVWILVANNWKPSNPINWIIAP